MMIKELVGDATKPENRFGDLELQFFPHVCNNAGGWGKGYVLAINKTFGNEAMNQYKSWYVYNENEYGRPFRLGEIDLVTVGPGKLVVNMIAQNGYKTVSNPVPLDYDALGKCLDKLAYWIYGYDFTNDDRDHDLRVVPTVHIPKMMGCGLAGGDWDEVRQLISDKLDDIMVRIYEFRGD